MSEQEGGLLQTKVSYDFNNSSQNYRAQSIDPNKFTSWQKNDMYKSSYANFHSRDSVSQKKSFIPGYAGFVPQVKAESLYGQGYTPLTKQTLTSARLGVNNMGLSTNGFNITRQAFIDGSKLASSSKYGKTAIQKSHPAWNETTWRTSTQEAFTHPKDKPDPLYRPTDKMSQTTKDFTKSSGFATNHAYQDGKGWNPHRILKGDNNRSEYRDRFNAKLDFHRQTNAFKERRLEPKQRNYKYN